MPTPDDSLLPGGRTPPSSPRRARRWPWAVGAGGVLLVAGLVLLRQPLSERLWPDTRPGQLREAAARALADGELSRADGRGARELYEAALALDPDRPDAREGLARVGEAALADADAALRQDRLEDARVSLALARELSVPLAAADALDERLRQREADGPAVGEWLAAAQLARSEGRLDGDAEAALPLYERVLGLQPDNGLALDGREDVLAEILVAARGDARTGDLAAAVAAVERARAADPGHGDLPAAVAAVAEAVDLRLRGADMDLAGGRLEPAADGYRAVLAVRPDATGARHGLATIARSHATRASRLAADFRFREAELALSAAREALGDAPEVETAAADLQRARQVSARLENPLPPAERQQRVGELLAAAAQAERAGKLLAPPGDSAYDRFRAAQAIAPRDPAVLAMAARLVPASQQCFNDALLDNRLSMASACLDAHRLLGGSGGWAGEARQRLARRWIALGDERLGAGELGAARQALLAARSLDASADGLDDFSQRLSAAAVIGN